MANLEDDRVLTLREWWELVGLSRRAAQSLIARGEGPTITQLSPKRKGVRVKHHREWLDRRAIGPEAAC